MSKHHFLWVFQGDNSDCINGIFSSKDLAELYIKEYSLTGILIKFPLDISVYQWTIAMGYFSPTKDYMRSSNFIQNFNSAYLEHYHFRDGNAL